MRIHSSGRLCIHNRPLQQPLVVCCCCCWLLGTVGGAKETSFYDSLGVLPSASTQDIKKAYRNLARKWHPDKNPDAVAEAEAKFREIANAYEVLVDSDSRATYDQHGAAGTGTAAAGQKSAQKGGDSSGFKFSSANDVFRQVFGDEDPFQDFQSDLHPPLLREPAGRHRHTRRSSTQISFGPGGVINMAQEETIVDDAGRTVTRRVQSQLGARGQVRRPLRPFRRSVLTEIYLCNVCSCQEILRRNGRG
jgi:curved DNA-binding protein CbpA